MGKIQEDILESFYQELTKLEDFDEAIVKELRDLLSSDKKPKADAVAAVFARHSETNSQ